MIIFSNIYRSCFKYKAFQFGPADDCANNYMEILDVQQNGGGEAWRARYCGNVSRRPPTVYVAVERERDVSHLGNVSQCGGESTLSSRRSSTFCF